LIPVLGAGLLAASPMVRQRFEAVYAETGTVDSSPVATSSGIRIVIWSTTRELIERRPWFGYGMGGFVPAYDKLIHEHVVDSNNWRDASRAKDTHNQYLHVLVEAGVLGLAAFVFFGVCVLREPAPAPYRGFGLALFLAWLATSLFNSHFQTFAEAHLIGLVLGALLAADAVPYTAGGAEAARIESTSAVTAS
jgi:O-antigen ligase